MELGKLESTDKVLSMFKTFGLISVIGSIALIAGSTYYNTQQIKAAVSDLKQSVFVLDRNDNIYQASAEKRDDHELRLLQYSLQLELWTKNWFQYDVNDYKQSIDKGYAISGVCGSELYALFTDKKVYEDMITNDKHYKIYFNAPMMIDERSRPVSGTIDATRVIYTPVGEIHRKFIGKVTFSEGEISPSNRLGIIIDTFQLLDYSVTEKINY